jgi:hypothetical protein
MGFLFDMLEKAEGSTCQATNMLKTLSNHPQGMDELCSFQHLQLTSL